MLMLQSPSHSTSVDDVARCCCFIRRCCFSCRHQKLLLQSLSHNYCFNWHCTTASVNIAKSTSTPPIILMNLFRQDLSG
ncbi:conserved hypothetical protein [Ricinus communis]|uniref:Uncharacterized protein n=1 Tax=Ricinus communis TaxID=3988 RepID=B9S831_RICCO|nr:conserved hypothetical protein [Ricinus communis]